MRHGRNSDSRGVGFTLKELNAEHMSTAESLKRRLRASATPVSHTVSLITGVVFWKRRLDVWLCGSWGGVRNAAPHQRGMPLSHIPLYSHIGHPSESRTCLSAPPGQPHRIICVQCERSQRAYTYKRPSGRTYCDVTVIPRIRLKKLLDLSTAQATACLWTKTRPLWQQRLYNSAFNISTVHSFITPGQTAYRAL